MNEWRKVIFAADCIEDGDDLLCPICMIDYAECPCPGPNQDDLYEYEVFENGMMARRKEAPNG